MTAEEIYTELDRAGLTPSVHWSAAPQEWREVCLKLETDIEEEICDAVNEATT